MKIPFQILVLCTLTIVSIFLAANHLNQTTGIPENIIPTVPTIDTGQIKTINNQPEIELVFVLDTTASMGGLIQAAKEKIWSIASTMAAAKPAPQISMGIIAYRDRGDDYVTKIINLSTNLDLVYTQLIDLTAEGGGDEAESVNAALFDAVHRINWSNKQDTYKAIFLVGDAPGHNDYPNDVPFTETLMTARLKGIKVNTIQAGENKTTTQAWHQIATLGKGASFQVAQQGNAIAITTPYDQAIAAASKDYDDTRLYFGDAQQQSEADILSRSREKIYQESSPASLARRAKYHSTKSAQFNSDKENDLISQIVGSRIKREEIQPEHLPQAMQTMSSEQQTEFINDKIASRQIAENEIKQLTEKRENYIKEKLSEMSDLDSSLDRQLLRTLQHQAKQKGFELDESTSSY